MIQNRTDWLRLANIAALVITLFMNGISNSDWFPQTVGDLGESYGIFFLPAGYVFGIWGVIYSGLLAYVIFQAREEKKADSVARQIGGWFIISCVGNVAWLLLFLYSQLWLSTVAMLVILGSLLVIYTRLNIGLNKDATWGERLAVHVPFSIYLGWISVATVANFSTALFDSGSITAFAGIDSATWAAIMMGVAAVLAFGMLALRRDLAYALVIVWATVGINARPFDTDLYSAVASLDASLVNSVAIGVAAIVGVAVLARAASLLIGNRTDNMTPV
ncbi:MAG: TspO/MBR family protein, partial [Chloroflexota bacterium]